MLKAVAGFLWEPAAASSRRLLALLLFAAVGCGPRPLPPVVSPAREAAQRAIGELRRADPRAARLLEGMVADAETATAFEQHASFWDHTPGRVEALWLRVLRQASTSLRQCREREGALREQVQQLLLRAHNELSRARQELEETGMGRRENAAFQRASGAVLRAQALAKVGQWPQAAELLRAALSDATVVHKAFISLHARFGDPAQLRLWRRWVEETLQQSREEGSVVIIVDKLRRRLTVYLAGERLASFPAELGVNGLRPKQHAGDRATPEGRYQVVQKKQGSATKYYKALLINYPNEEDRLRFFQAKRQGKIPWRAGIGSLIEIHGEGGEGRDWTDGCVALRNRDMDQVFAWAQVGTPVTIVGTYERER